MIYLRPLKLKDKSFMKEWMTDPDVIKFFRFSAYNDDKVTQYIENSINDPINKHFAIVDNNDDYLGTISLKNIDLENKHAEYAVVLRKKYWGKGIGRIATHLILDYAEKLKLHKIYLNVLQTNTSAINLYLSCGFVESGIYRDHLFRDKQYYNLLYFEKIMGGE